MFSKNKFICKLVNFVLLISFIPIFNKKIKFIKIPFYIETNNYTKDTLIESLINQKILTKIKIGSQKQNLILNIKLHQYFTLISNFESNITNEKFNNKKSKTFKNLSKSLVYSGDYDYREGFVASDTLIFSENKKFNEYKFFSVNISKNNDSGVLGFEVGPNYFISSNKLDELSLIKYLKNKNYINEYSFTFLFNSYNNSINNKYNNNHIEGNILIGPNLHDFFPYNYNVSDYFSSKISTEDHYYLIWEIGFNKILFNDSLAYFDRGKCEDKAKISIEFGLIEGTHFIHMKLKDTFFKQNGCYHEKNNITEYYYFYCEDYVNISNFPSFIFNTLYDNYNFTLTYEDLFFKYENKYYFLMVFKSSYHWIFGNIFLRKYNITFNMDKKIISWYSKYNNNINKKNRRINYYIIIIVFLFIFIVFLIFVILKMYNKLPRRKRIYELKDNNYYYNYDSFDENKNNINNRKNELMKFEN